jgi:putative PIN family toxin of toxin-antitoxin system
VIRAVFDTNVFISAVLFGGTPRALLVAAWEGLFQLSISQPILTEINRVLRSRFNYEASLLEELNREIGSLCEWTEPAERIRACRDPDDDQVLECAVSARAQYVITGDADLLELDPFRGIRILSPSAFWSLKPWERR